MAPRSSLVSLAARQLRLAQPSRRAALPAARSLSALSSPSFARRESTSRTSHLARAFSTSPTRFAALPPRADYKKLTAEDVSAFAGMLSSPSSIVTTIAAPNGEWATVAKDDLVSYNNDWMDKYFGDSSLLLKPKTTEEVSKIMAYCYHNRIAVVPQGGNTGLVGGGVPVYDELILSTEAMNSVREFDDVSGQSSPRRPHPRLPNSAGPRTLARPRAAC